MKISEIQKSDICQHLREVEENLDENENKSLEIMKTAAIEYIKGSTGLDNAKLDKHEDLTVALLVIISDMWNNRILTVDKSSENELVKSILHMHSVNLVPTE